MIIELVGLPASGKSTFARELQKRCGIKRVKIKTKFRLLLLNGLFCIKHPMFSTNTLYYILKNSPNFKIFYYKLMNVLLHHGAKHEEARLFGSCVIDEGHYQNIISIFENVESRDDLEKYISAIPKQDLLIFFKIPIEKIRKTGDQRGYLARETLISKKDIDKWLKVALKNSQTLKELLPHLNLNYFIVKTDQDKEKILAKISQSN